MRKILVLWLLLISTILPAYAQIPNGGFENWETEADIEIPSAPWITNNLQKKPDGVTYNPATKSTDHYPINVGSYSMRLENNIAFASNPGEPLPYWACSYGYSSTAFYPGYTGPVFPITGHPDSLYGYYKFLPQNNDTMSFYIGLYYQRELVAFATWYDTTTVTEWTVFGISLPAYTTADSAQIGFGAFYLGLGSNLPTGPQGNSVLYLDNLSFDEPVSTSATEKKSSWPVKYELGQNFPNPFNPITTIEFTLSHPEYTTLKVYDITGMEVGLLISGKLQAGVHRYRFDGNNLASGVYFYQVTAGEFREVKKMILLR